MPYDFRVMDLHKLRCRRISLLKTSYADVKFKNAFLDFAILIPPWYVSVRSRRVTVPLPSPHVPLSLSYVDWTLISSCSM